MSEFARYEPDVPRSAAPLDLHVRAGAASDVEQCVALLSAVRGETPEAWLPMFRRTLAAPDKLLVVAEVDGQIVGYARAVLFVRELEAPADAAPDGYYLMGLVVHPRWRRQGIARQLTQARLTWAWPRTDVVWYFASTDNRASIDLHTTFDFREVTRNFSYPGLTFNHGTGVLFCASRPDESG
jgi:GNAT superfamily N-acetyltransferase